MVPIYSVPSQKINYIRESSSLVILMLQIRGKEVNEVKFITDDTDAYHGINLNRSDIGLFTINKITRSIVVEERRRPFLIKTD